MLTLDELRADDSLDTVVVAFTDRQGRLTRKRLHRDFFLDGVWEHGAEGCDYLLALEMDGPGFRLPDRELACATQPAAGRRPRSPGARQLCDERERLFERG